MESNKNILEELILDESFQNYVIHNQEEGKWQHWLEQHPQDQENFKKATAFVNALKFKNQEISQKQINDEIAKFDIRVQKEQGNPSGKVVSLWKRALQLAAIVALLLATTFVLYKFPLYQPEEVPVAQTEIIIKKTALGVKSQIRLPDGTLVKLNSGSEIRYPSRFDGKIRSVELLGEAYFQVVQNKSKPFVVSTSGMKTTVLGTSFVISSFNKGSAEVSLLEGSVLVTSDKEEKILKPGQKLSLNGNSIEISNYDYNEDFGWKEGILYFNDASAEVIFEKLKLWYGVEFSFESIDLPQLKYSGFYKNQDLETVLNGLGYSLKFDFEIKEKMIKIKFN
ncbi:FecR domain-containing protein [Reichenbachiella sp. MALMAid0571]|uniref:FecR family protein n=1 Tax=Reichenbachiella sp. MALMAid0571 TaxID=3143939 RepID=UPI0032E0503A